MKPEQKNYKLKGHDRTFRIVGIAIMVVTLIILFVSLITLNTNVGLVEAFALLKALTVIFILFAIGLIVIAIVMLIEELRELN